jgi:hypothetical protein
MLYAMQEQVRRAGQGKEAVGQVMELMLALDSLIHGRGGRAHAQRLLEAAQAETWWELMCLSPLYTDTLDNWLKARS